LVEERFFHSSFNNPFLKGAAMLRLLATLALLALLTTPVVAASNDMEEGSPDLQSAGPIAFGPTGVLFIGDPLGAAVFAVETNDTAGTPDKIKLNVEEIDQKVAAALGTKPDGILINDLAVNPASGVAYLSVSRGRGPDAIPVILKVDREGTISEFPLEDVKFAKAKLPNAPEDKVTGEGRRRGNQRLESITDLAYVDGKLFVAGLSNEEFASKLRSIPYPFEKPDEGASIEIYHGSHGAYETRSPVRTFTVVDIEETPHLLAAYTCTPLVKIPVDMLKAGEKIRGETIAELGNRNRPLDMIVYEKDGHDYVLMANSARGVMKLPLEEMADVDAITQRVEDKAGVDYETIDGVDGVVQLDRLNDANALLLVQDGEGGSLSLVTLALP
jgi:hypothetical protein